MKSLLNKLGQVSRAMPIKPSGWPHFDLIYVHSNSLSLTINNADDVIIKEEQAILIYPKKTFSGSSTNRNVTTISVHHFSLTEREMDELPSSLKTFLSNHRGFAKFSDAGMVKDDVRRLLKTEPLKNDKANAFMLDALVSLVMANLISSFGRQQLSTFAVTMMEIDEYIRKNVAKPITPDMLARQAGFSVNYFRVLFTDFFGMTPGKYINMIKMKEASKLLIETILPVKAVALKVGFAQPSNFHRSFTKFHKITPRKCREHRPF